MSAMAALALSASGHGQLPNQLTHVAPRRPRPPKKTQAKKTHQQRKKTPDLCWLEEDPPEEDPTFRPADLPHFQNTGDIGMLGGGRTGHIADPGACERWIYRFAANGNGR
jgi:hypothetical protein